MSRRRPQRRVLGPGHGWDGWARLGRVRRSRVRRTGCAGAGQLRGVNHGWAVGPNHGWAGCGQTGPGHGDGWAGCGQTCRTRAHVEEIVWGGMLTVSSTVVPGRAVVQRRSAKTTCTR